MLQTWDFSCHWHLSIAVNRQNHSGPTNCKLCDGWKPLQPVATNRRIHVEQTIQVRWESLHFDLKSTVCQSGLPTSFRYHLPLRFHNCKSCLHKHLSKVWGDPNRADWQGFHPMRHPLEHSTNTDTGLSTATLPIQRLKLWPWTQIKKNIRKTASSKSKKQHAIACD